MALTGRVSVIMAGIVAALTASAAMPCVVATRAPNPGESDAAFQARTKAEDATAERYQKLSEAERAAIDQARWWDMYPAIFLVRVEKVRIAGRIYGIDRPATAKPRYMVRHGRRVPLPPAPMAPPAPLTLEAHRAYLSPVAWLKGEPNFTASWQDVGGMTSCGNMVDGDLGFAAPGDTLIVFAQDEALMRQRHGAWVSSKRVALFGLRSEQAVDPRLVAGVRALAAPAPVP